MRMLIAVAIVLVGLAAGLGLGMALRVPPGAGDAGAPVGGAGEHSGAGPAETQPADIEHPQPGPGAGAGARESGAAAPGDTGESAPAGADRSYVKINRQIVVPVVVGGQTRALMLFDLALDVPHEMAEPAYAAEPRLRDAFLRELFEMSHTGAFLTDYTDERVVAELREKLGAAARRILGNAVAEVLILDIVRQEL